MGTYEPRPGGKLLPIIACLLPLFLVASLGSARGDDSAALIETSETCLDCHEELGQTLAGTVHELTMAERANRAVAIGCISCHSGWEEHLEDPSEENIGNPARALSAETAEICSACHQPHIAAGVVGSDPHQSLDLSCSNCHSIHSGTATLLIDAEAGFCEDCHPAVVNAFRGRSNHPLTDQAVTCVSCHDFTGKGEASFGHGGNVNCFTCHPEQSGPYVFEHEATSSFSTQGAGCVSCHKPHGSPNDRLLAQVGDQLCRQCHGTPPLHLIKHDGIGSEFLCIECHSDIHGSYTSRKLLDPQLGTLIGGAPEACFCHEINY